MAELSDLLVASLGEARYESPLAEFVADRRTNEHYVDEDDRVVFHDTVFQLSDQLSCPSRSPEDLPSFEPGGPRRRLFFPPGATKVGVVTCGGLCPGLNDVIRGLVMELGKHYGIDEVLGFRHGFAGLVKGGGLEPVRLTPEVVHDINTQGGTMLGTSRGAQDPDEMVDCLLSHGIDILFVVGGDGSMRGAAGIAAAAAGAGPADRRDRDPEDHRQRHPLHRPEFRLRHLVQRRGQGDQRRSGRGSCGHRRCGAGQAHGPPLGLHRLLRRAGQPRRRLRAHPRGAVPPGRSHTVSWPLSIRGSRIEAAPSWSSPRARDRTCWRPATAPTRPATPTLADIGVHLQAKITHHFAEAAARRSR